jgi:hypothetical protein
VPVERVKKFQGNDALRVFLMRLRRTNFHSRASRRPGQHCYIVIHRPWRLLRRHVQHRNLHSPLKLQWYKTDETSQPLGRASRTSTKFGFYERMAD